MSEQAVIISPLICTFSTSECNKTSGTRVGKTGCMENEARDPVLHKLHFSALTTQSMEGKGDCSQSIDLKTEQIYFRSRSCLYCEFGAKIICRASLSTLKLNCCLKF